MIDIENRVFTTVSEAVEAEFPGIAIEGDYPETFAVFPAMSINEIGNLPLWDTMDEQLHEHHALVNYEINVYCNDQFDRKGTCKAILKAADAAMHGMKFVRTTGPRRLPNVDRSIYRMYARYSAVVSEGEEMENGTILHRMYRNKYRG